MKESPARNRRGKKGDIKTVNRDRDSISITDTDNGHE